MKTGLPAGIALLALTSGAGFAADLDAVYNRFIASPERAYNWSGFYVGAKAGWAYTLADHQTKSSPPTLVYDLEPGGTLLTGTVGVNWQVGNIVFGLEGDWGWSLINDTGSGCPVGCFTNVNSLGTLRPRIGVMWNGFMPYATGGYAWGLINAGQPGFTINQWEPGWVFGGGLEVLLAPNWSVKAEFLSARLRSSTYVTAAPITANHGDINSVTVGVNYHFNSTHGAQPGQPAPPSPAAGWSGFYLGANGGWGWAQTGMANALLPGDPFFLFDQSGAVVGGTVGANVQQDIFVLGVEADWAWADINGTGTGPVGSTCLAGCFGTVSSIATLRPRFGVTWNGIMPYATGGIAWGLVKSGQPGFGSEVWQPGVVVGAGAEFMLAPNWSAKAEYLLARLNDSGYTAAGPIKVNQRDVSMIRGGINYHFGWAGER